ncbi:hypothetical protein PISMIDRAFT_685656 [Pisolithus microcarpus 441]|uniref:Unplaced genomic scaffold scaffold_154, whole genome shotgun sequence n=1 Tax=Pisolithus microcarpus 441 TaxID=765257 RepID=A0A0C9Z3X6_9AGAM|nr:hypothetical protein PISMIDRAFT_685656 [Pisolithus microcarpus 441]
MVRSREGLNFVSDGRTGNEGGKDESQFQTMYDEACSVSWQRYRLWHHGCKVSGNGRTTS